MGNFSRAPLMTSYILLAILYALLAAVLAAIIVAAIEAIFGGA